MAFGSNLVLSDTQSELSADELFETARRSIVVIPTFNERENVSLIVPHIFRLFPSINILVVDDNSPDGTGELADELALSHNGLSVIHREKKMGLGTAYIAGFEWALAREYSHIFEMDCDFSHDPADLPRFLAFFGFHNAYSAS